MIAEFPLGAELRRDEAGGDVVDYAESRDLLTFECVDRGTLLFGKYRNQNVCDSDFLFAVRLRVEHRALQQGSI